MVVKDCFGHKKDAIRLKAGLQIFELLSLILGKSFEPYVKELLPSILNCISDGREDVRTLANNANQ